MSRGRGFRYHLSSNSQLPALNSDLASDAPFPIWKRILVKGSKPKPTVMRPPKEPNPPESQSVSNCTRKAQVSCRHSWIKLTTWASGTEPHSSPHPGLGVAEGLSCLVPLEFRRLTRQKSVRSFATHEVPNYAKVNSPLYLETAVSNLFIRERCWAQSHQCCCLSIGRSRSICRFPC